VKSKNYNKLVRDKIPSIIESKGESCSTHVADDNEYKLKLKEKLFEEVSEYVEIENIEELADILEVIDALIIDRGFDREEIDRVKNEKREKKGGFEDRIILEKS